MENQFWDLLVDFSSEVLFLLWIGIVVSFLGQVVGVLLTHELDDVLLNLINAEFFLLNWSMLNHGLNNSTAIMLEDKLTELGSNQLNILGNEHLFVLTRHLQLLLLHQELVVVDSQFLNQIADLDFLSSDLGMWLVPRINTTFWLQIFILVWWLILVVGWLSVLALWAIGVWSLLSKSSLMLGSSLTHPFLVRKVDDTWSFLLVFERFFIRWFIACFLISLFIEHVHLG